MTQAGSLGQPRGMLNFHWWKTQAASPYADEVVTSLEACERCFGAVYSLDFLKVQGRSGRHGIEWEEERGHAPSSDTFPTMVGSQLLLLTLLLLLLSSLLLYHSACDVLPHSEANLERNGLQCPQGNDSLTATSRSEDDTLLRHRGFLFIFFIYLQILHYKGELLPLLLLHPFCIIHSILKTITHVLTYLYILPEHPPQSQYNAILQLFDVVYFLFLLCKERQREEEKKTDGIASMQ